MDTVGTEADAATLEVRPKQAKGLTREYLEAFIASEPDTPWGIRNRAMLALGYELLTRRSELVALKNCDLETPAV